MITWIAMLAITSLIVHSAFTIREASDPQASCLDIERCRTFAEIVSPAVTALVAAIYLSVHQNVPRLDGSPWYSNVLKSGLLAWITLVFPEWISAWAVRSYIIAHRLLPRLEEARKYAMEEWYDKAIDHKTPLACKQTYFSHSPMQSH